MKKLLKKIFSAFIGRARRRARRFPINGYFEGISNIYREDGLRFDEYGNPVYL